ncbi:proline-rich transmembrane protein 4 [Polypterus senegalus]|uniref:proline-rich transmembrane protein 4 n=1 Tax=Polypterus senegalus TaxID=55291 RepID=UPI0019656570|nr:proline-rich transmembrane protein 4 [Polypterus senegalus]
MEYAVVLDMPACSKWTMLPQGFMLTLVLWYSLFWVSVSEATIQNVEMQTSSPFLNAHVFNPELSSSPDQNDSLSVSWVPSELLMESKTPSVQVLPTDLRRGFEQTQMKDSEISQQSAEDGHEVLLPQPSFTFSEEVKGLLSPAYSGSKLPTDSSDEHRPTTVPFYSRTVPPLEFTETSSKFVTSQKKYPEHITFPVYTINQTQKALSATKTVPLDPQRKSNATIPVPEAGNADPTIVRQVPELQSGVATFDTSMIEPTTAQHKNKQEPLTVTTAEPSRTVWAKTSASSATTLGLHLTTDKIIFLNQTSKAVTGNETPGIEVPTGQTNGDQEQQGLLSQDGTVSTSQNLELLTADEDFGKAVIDGHPTTNSKSILTSISPELDYPENDSFTPFYMLPAPMFIPLHADWNTAMAVWGIAWEVHIYGIGSLYVVISFLAALSLLLLPFKCPSGSIFFMIVNIFLIIVGSSRAFSLFYDAYNHQDKLPSSVLLLLYEVPFPCLTSSFGVVFLLLSMRSRMQLSYSIFQHPCFLAVLVFFHFSASLGSIVLVQVLSHLPCLFFVSQGVFVVLMTLMSLAYFIFYCYVRADAKHIYHLNNTSPPIERYNRCPFADAKDWDRAAMTAVFSSMFALFSAALQLYAMLHALGFGGIEVFHPWPWWAFHLSCRICEVGMGLTLAIIVMYPLFCSKDVPQQSCWPSIFCLHHNHVTVKSPILPNNYQWSSSQQEKLVICDTIARSEIECLPLYTLVENHLSSLEGLDLLYHSTRCLTLKDLELNINPKKGSCSSSFTSMQMDSDSTADLHPPSPINLRRSIDEALFSEALIPESLFQNSKLYSSSNLSLNIQTKAEKRDLKENAADCGLYRTSSCIEMDTAPALKESVLSSDTLDATSSTEQWRGSSGSSLYKLSLNGSSLVLCSSPSRTGYSSLSSNRMPRNVSQTSLNQFAPVQRHYQTLGSVSRESLNEPEERDLALQAEFMNVCRQIDELSVSSDTIDL